MTEELDVKKQRINNIKILVSIMFVILVAAFFSLKSRVGNDRIVYGTSVSSKSKYESDCKLRGGVFNECGPSCEKTPCDNVAAVCYYTCELR